MKAKFRSFSLFALALFVFFSITSCDNFTNASDVRLQIEQNIAYNMAPSYTIELTPSIPSSGSFKSPVATESVDKKVSDSFTVTYEPSPEYAFIEWKVKDSNTGNDVDGYFLFESKASASTNCTFVKAPESGMQLCLYAVIVERPKELDHSPQWGSNGVPKDSRVQVRFTKPMDESSIYYDDNERDAIKEETGFQHFLPETGDGPKYGYVKSDKHYWKNISIVDNSDGVTSMLEYFEKPAFEDSRTFVITTKKTKPLTQGTELFVTINKNFLCKETGETTEKPVTLKDSIVWVYLVNNETDGQDPSFTSSSITNSPSGNLSTYTSSASTPTMLSKGTVDFNIQVSDGGSGPASVFNLELEDSSGQKKNVPIRFKSVIGTTAKYIGPYTFTVADGNYKINNITASDRSNRTTVKTFSNPYYIGIDNNAPKVNSLSVVPYGFRDNYKGQLKYTYSVDSSEKNLSSVNIKYKESGSSESWDEIDADPYSLTSNNSYFRIADVEPGKTYDIYAEFCDKANNSTVTIYKNVETLPKPLNAASVSVERISEVNKSDKFKFTWAKPEGSYSGVYITGTREKNGSSGIAIDEVVLDSNNTQEYTITASYLDTKYTYELYTVKGKGSNDVDRSAASVQTVIWSKPNKISSENITVSMGKTCILITSKEAIEMKVRYKKTTETEFGDPANIIKNGSTYQAGTLVPGSCYDIMITKYNSESDLESDPIFYKNMYTAPAMPKNFQITTSSNTTNASATLTWNTPEGNFDNYKIEYTKYENSTENWKSQDIPKTENSYTISGLELLTKYRFRIKTVYKYPSTQTTLSSDYSAPAPVSTPPQAATFNCSFDETYNVNVEWSLPGKAPYVDNDSVIKLCYGASEDDVKAETNFVKLGFNFNMVNLSYQPVAETLTRANIGLYNQNCYFAIKTTCKNSSDELVTSWSEVKSLLMPPDIKPYEISVSLRENVCSDSAIVSLKKPTGAYGSYGSTTWDKINIYKQTDSGEQLIGSINNTDNKDYYYYLITGLSPETTYTILARTEINSFESYSTTTEFTTLPTINANSLNLRVVKESGKYRVLWQYSAIYNKDINDVDIERVGIRYRKKDSTVWQYPDKWGGKVTASVISWSNGYETTAGNTDLLQSLSSGTYVIELVTYHKTTSLVTTTVTPLSSNSIEYIVP